MDKGSGADGGVPEGGSTGAVCAKSFCGPIGFAFDGPEAEVATDEHG